MKDKMMICRMGHTLTEGIEFCRDEDCRHYKCDASKCPPEDRNCVFCIPYEPEPQYKCTVEKCPYLYTFGEQGHCFGICCYSKKVEPQSWCNTCHKRVGCKGNTGQVISCPDYEPQAERKVEILNKEGALNISGVRIVSEPATCPDCGHPAHKGKECSFWYDQGIGAKCVCPSNPADLQPESTPTLMDLHEELLKLKNLPADTTVFALYKYLIDDLQPEKQRNHSWVKRNEETNLVPYLECIYCKIRKLPEQPTQMPLREILAKFICQGCSGEGCNEIIGCEEIGNAEKAITAWHNSQVVIKPYYHCTSPDKETCNTKDKCETYLIGKYPCYYWQKVTDIESLSSAIAAQARKRTLKYVEATLERAFVNLSPIEQGVLNICLAHIRAMAKGKE